MTGVALVTGASGFVGRRLAERLTAQGWRVHALMRRPAAGPWVRQRCLDLARDEVPADLLVGVDAVFHAAGRAHAVAALGEDDADYYPVNVGGTERLLTAAVTASVSSFVYLSSVKAVADPPGAWAADESFAAPADTPYGRSKRAAERLVLATGPTAGVHTCVLRPALVYGPGVKGNLDRMLRAVDRGRFPPLPEVGNVRTMVHVDDLADAALLAAADPRANGATYIVTDGRTYSTRQMYVEMCAALGHAVPRWTVPVAALAAAASAGDVVGRLTGRRAPFDSPAMTRLTDSAHYCSTRIRELGFRPAWTLESALPQMVAAYRSAGEQSSTTAADQVIPLSVPTTSERS